MMATEEVKAWLNSLPAEAAGIFIDDGGSCLRAIGTDGMQIEATWCEVGGRPFEDDPVMATPAEVAECLDPEGGI
jgi:hypothetical protein